MTYDGFADLEKRLHPVHIVREKVHIDPLKRRKNLIDFVPVLILLNPSRLEYKMPRTYEMPEISHHLVESIDPYGLFGAKEIGEGIIVTSGGAITSAVFDALGGIYLNELPMTPWRVLRAIKRNEHRLARESAA